MAWTRPSRRRRAAPASAGRAPRPARRRRPGTAPRRRARRRARRSSGPATTSGRDAPRLEQPEQRDLDREQRGLGERGPVQQRPRPRRRRPRAAAGPGARPVRRTPRRRPRRTPGTRRTAPGPCPGRCEPWPGEQDGGPGRRVRRPCHGAGRASPAASAARPRAAASSWLPADDRRAAARSAVRFGQRVRRRPRAAVRARSETGQQPGRLGPQRRSAFAAGQQPRAPASAGAGGRCLRGLDGRACSRITCALVPLIPNDGHPGPARAVRLRPRPRLGEQLDRAGGPVDVRRRLVDVQGLRQHAVPHRHDHLDHAGDAGRGLGVPDVGLHRAEPAAAGPRRGPGRRWRAAPAPRSGRRAWCRCRAPRPRPRRPAASPASASAWPDHPLLRRAVRRGQAVGRAVLVDRRAAHHREHRVPVAPRVGQPLHQQHADALGPAGAVGGGGERLAAAVARPARAAGENSTNASGVAITVTPPASASEHSPWRSAWHRQVQRDQRRRARGVDGDRRAFEAEGVGDAGRRRRWPRCR